MKNTRLKIALSVLVINYILFCVGMYMGIDLISIGTGLSLLNTPLYAYILGETKRKSNENSN